MLERQNLNDNQNQRSPHQLGLPVLYSFRRCPYAMRARLAIAVCGLQVEIREIELRAKPAHMLEISPKATVPVLWLANGVVIDESLEIMRWALEQNYPQDFLRLNSAQTAQCDAWIAVLDGEFKYNLDRYKYPNRYHDKQGDIDPIVHRAVCANILRRWNAELEQSSGYLFGAQASVADCAILPFVRQFRLVDEVWFDAQQDLKAVQNWLNSLLNSNAFAEVMTKFKPWQPGDEALVFPEHLRIATFY